MYSLGSIAFTYYIGSTVEPEKKAKYQSVCRLKTRTMLSPDRRFHDPVYPVSGSTIC
jgi:hypothetical protein